MKKISLFIILILTVISFPTTLSATDLGWNGGANGDVPGTTGGSCNSTWNGFCNWNNANHETIKVTFAYINNGSVTRHGSPIYITNNRRAVTVVSSKFDTSSLIAYSDMNKGSVTLNSNLHGSGAAGTLETYFTNLENFKFTLSKMGLDYDTFDFKESQKAPVPTGYGYRMIIEPVQTGFEKNIAKLMTLKETADLGRTNKSFWSDSSIQAQLWLHLEYADVGFSKALTSGYPVSTDTSTPYRVPEVARFTSGYDIALVDVSDVIKKSVCKTKKDEIIKTKGKTSTEYKKLINDTAWAINNNATPAKSDLECFTCEEYIENWGADNQIVKDLKAGGKIDWTLPKCGGGANSCAEFKAKNPSPTYSQMLDANKKWTNCYTCDNNAVFKANTPSCNSGSCSYSLNISVPNNCSIKKDGYVKDITNWGCIFDSTKQSDSNIRAHYAQNDMSSNRFCDVYCREDVEYKYPDDKMTVLAGRRFTIGNSGFFPTLEPVQFTSTTNCRTTSANKKGEIDIDKFKTTWNSADAKVNSTWNSYQQAQANLRAAQAATSRPISGTCTRTSCSGSGENRTCTTVVTGHWSGTSHSGRANHGVYSGSASWQQISGCRSASRPNYEGMVSSALSSYQAAKQAREQVLIEMHQCNNFQYTNRKFKPTVNFKYEEAIYGNKDITLKETGTIIADSKWYASGNALGSASSSKPSSYWSTGSYENSSTDIIKGDNTIRGTSSTVNRYDCDKEGSRCVYNYNIQRHENNKWVEQTTEKKYEYTLPPGVYEYISKPSGLSVDTKAEALKYSNQYYNLGYSNLPVHYSRKTGKYDYEFNIETFGNKSKNIDHKFNKYIIKNMPFGSTHFTGKTKYMCTYNVKNEILICPPGKNCDDPCTTNCDDPRGLSVIYRPISLIDPFPGEKGTGRTPGPNWNYAGIIKAYISENRGVKDYNIYINRDPLYKITLTPALIKEIREHNNKQKAKKETYYDYNGGKGKVTGMAGYSDFELDCDGNGVNCKSRFIRGVVNGYNFSKYFSGCGIKGKNTNLKCVNGEAW